MKILVINSGSSSLKFQVIDMQTEQVLARGVCERIGIDGIFTYKTGADVRKFDQYLTEQGVDHVLKSYDGTENELLHVFNISSTDWAESIAANQDEIDFMESLLK